MSGFEFITTRFRAFGTAESDCGNPVICPAAICCVPIIAGPSIAVAIGGDDGPSCIARIIICGPSDPAGEGCGKFVMEPL